MLNRDTEVTVFYNDRRLKAIKEALAEKGSTVESELKDMMDVLYETVLPKEVCDEIDEQIAKDQAADDAEREASRRFAVMHIRENGEDTFLTNDYFGTFLSAAYRYRLYERGELTAQPKTLTEAFCESGMLDEDEYESLCEKATDDERITAVLDFDLDEKTVRNLNTQNGEWKTYRLHDVSVAAYKANRSDTRAPQFRQITFDSALDGREIEPPAGAESETEDGGMTLGI